MRTYMEEQMQGFYQMLVGPILHGNSTKLDDVLIEQAMKKENIAVIKKFKKEIKQYYKKILSQHFNIKKIVFRGDADQGQFKMMVYGGHDGKARGDISVNEFVSLIPEYSVADTMLRVHSLHQYFLRYDIGAAYKDYFYYVPSHHRTIDNIQIAVALMGFDTTLREFTSYRILEVNEKGELLDVDITIHEPPLKYKEHSNQWIDLSTECIANT